MNTSQKVIELTEAYGANNYHPLPVVISHATGVWIEDPEGNRYLDMLSAYSAVNQGHCHPKIIEALKNQAEKVTLTSRAFHNDQLGIWYEKVCKLTNKEMALPMNTGAEAVETALKAARLYGYDVKGIESGKAEIIACTGNFHGRTIATISLSTDPDNAAKYGPLLPNIEIIPYGDIEALDAAINENTAGFILEPIQGEAGVIIPPTGFLKAAAALCKKKNVLFIADEIQVGLGRCGKSFASDWEDVSPDIIILGKALGGGVMPISCIAANKDILDVFTPGSHGSTFGGNPLACAVSIAALEVLESENLVARSLELGQYFLEELQKIQHPVIKEVRGRGLLIGMELTESARPYCEALQKQGLLCKETHEFVIRFSPPLIIEKDTLDWALTKIKTVFS